MDFWSVMLIFAFMAGIMGWFVTPFTSAVLWYCDWRDGQEVNFANDTIFTLIIPFAWMFAILEIVLLYCK